MNGLEDKMKSPVSILVAALLFCASPLLAQHPGGDPLGENFFPPDLVMRHQQAIGLSQAQRQQIQQELVKMQARFTELQWQLQSEMEGMAALTGQDKVDEGQVLGQLDKILDLEREIKRTHLTLVIRIKNALTAEQQARLRGLVQERKGQG